MCSIKIYSVSTPANEPVCLVRDDELKDAFLLRGAQRHLKKQVSVIGSVAFCLTVGSHKRYPTNLRSVKTLRTTKPYNRDMRKDPAELLKDALSLPPEGRAALADSLLESLDQEVDEGVEQAWLDEIQKRLREIDTGAVAMIPWEEAERRLWAKVPSK